MSEAEMSCHRKKFPGIRRKFLASEEISWHQKKFIVTERNYLSEKETSCHRKEFNATVRNFFSQKEILLSQEEKIKACIYGNIINLKINTQITAILKAFCSV